VKQHHNKTMIKQAKPEKWKPFAYAARIYVAKLQIEFYVIALYMYTYLCYFFPG
jgi:hypothetical protein